ncbi:tetratricopeptide repeat protein [Streptomyces sp. NPDC059153]|uniref:tetratricopeptide repeat protein n=1 Tax=Streptomyces sp. NPDC059153 TaxID=3346743 RepID=UPI0036B7B951
MTNAAADSAFSEDLRLLAALKRGQLGGRPSDRALAKRAAVAPTTVGQWLRGSSFPQSIDGLLAVVAALREQAASLGCLDDGVADLLREQRWRDSYRAEARRRAMTTSLEVKGAQARSALAAQELGDRLARLPDKPRLLSQWTPEQLGVHPAISAGRASGKGDFVLPAYISRPHDDALRAHLLNAAKGSKNRLVVIRGESCTGKTRTAYEAIHATTPEWNLIFPKGGDSLLAALESGAAQPETILWLNEAQDFLSGSAGELVAVELRRLLEGEGPIIVIATLWPTFHRELTTSPEAGRRDFHPQARALLRQEYRVDIPARFTESTLSEIREQAAADPSLSLTLSAGTSSVTQFLAAAPDLLDHYEHAIGPEGPYGKAVITAAMDVRRLGFNGDIPITFLRDAAPGYLSDEERASCNPETWFSDAMSYARFKVRGVVAALSDAPRLTGMGAQPGVVRLADYLDQYSHSSRTALVPSAQFWHAAQQIESVEDLLRLADAARERMRNRHAALIYQKAVSLGSTEAMRWLAFLREDAGYAQEAEALRSAAAIRGDKFAVRDMARSKALSGDPNEGEHIAEKAATESDYPVALWEIGRIRLKDGSRSDARRIFQRAAALGSTEAIADLLYIEREDGNFEAAEDHLQTLVSSEEADSLYELADRFKEKGDLAYTERLYRRAIEMGDDFSTGQLALLLKEAGKRVEAETLLNNAVDAGGHYHSLELGRMKEEDGDMLAAEMHYLSAYTHGVFDSPHALAWLWDRNGERVLAEEIVTGYAESGNFAPLVDLARSRSETGDDTAALSLLRTAIDLGNSVALAESAQILEKSGDKAGAERLARRAADSGESYPLRNFARNQCEPSWRTLLLYGLEPDGTNSGKW